MLKRLFFAAGLCLILASVSVAMAPAGDPPTIEVLDFHGKHRCRTCLTIEELTRETLKQNFSRELESRRITFQLLDAEAEANAKLVRELEVTGTALVLIVHQGNKRTPIDLTSMAFMNAHDRKAFQAKLTAELKKHL